MEDSLIKEVSCSNVSEIGDLCMTDATNLSGSEALSKWENREITQGLDAEEQRMVDHIYPKQDTISIGETEHEQNSFNELGKVQTSHEGGMTNQSNNSTRAILDSVQWVVSDSKTSSAHGQNRPNKTEDSPEEAEKCTGLNEQINDSDIDNVSPLFLSNSSNSLYSQTKEGFVTMILNEKSHLVPNENDTLSELNSTDSNEKVIIQSAEHLCDTNDNLKLSSEVLSVKCYDVDQSTLPANSENYLNYKAMSEETGNENSKVSEAAVLKLNYFDIRSKETVQSLEHLVDEGIQSMPYEDFRDGSLESLGEEDSNLEIIESKHEQKSHTVAIQENEYTDTDLKVSELDADGRIEISNDSDINSGKTSKAQSVSQEKSFVNELKSEGSLESFMSYSDKRNSINDVCMANLTSLNSISSFRSDEPSINEGHQREDSSPSYSGAVFHNSSLQDSILSNVIDLQTVLQMKKLLLALSSELEKEKLHFKHHVKLLTAQITTLEAKLVKHEKSIVDCVYLSNNKMNGEMTKNNTLVNISPNVISLEERLKNTSNEVEECKQELRSAHNKSLNTIKNTKEDYVIVSAKLVENDKTPNFVNDLDRIIFLADELMKSNSFKEINILEKINQTNCNHNGENIKRLGVLKRFCKNYFELLKSNYELTVLNRKLEESSERDKKLLNEKNETIKAFSEKYGTLNREYKQVQKVLKENMNEHNQHLKTHSDLKRSFKLTKKELDQLKYHNCLNELELNILGDIEITNDKLKDDNELLKAEIESVHHNYINKYDIMKKISLLEEENTRLKNETSDLSEQFKRETEKYDELNERCKKWQLLYNSLNDKLKKSETTFNKLSSNNEKLKEVVEKELFEDHFISGFRQLFALDEQLVDFNPDNFSKDLINEGFQRLRQRLIKLQELGKNAHFEKNRANNMEVKCSILNSIVRRREFEINSLSEKLKQEVNSHKATIKSLMNCNETSGLKSQNKNLEENLSKALNNISESECDELKEYIKQLKIDLVDSNAKISSLELHIESCCSYNRKRVQDYKQELFAIKNELKYERRKFEIMRRESFPITMTPHSKKTNAVCQTEIAPVAHQNMGIIERHRMRELEDKILKLEKDKSILTKLCHKRADAIKMLQSHCKN